MVNFLWVIFRADNIKDAFIYLSRMFVGGFDLAKLLATISFEAIIAFILAIVFNGFIQRYIKIKNPLATSVISIILLTISMIFMINGTYNPFIYYQF